MTGWSFIVSLLGILMFSQSQQIETHTIMSCSTESVRSKAVDNILAAMEYNSLDCALYETVLKFTASNPAASCAEIFISLGAPSGYYWLQSANGSAVRVFCDMTLICKGVGGGWMQVAKLDMTNSSHQCPPGTRLRADLLASHNKRLCGIYFDGVGCSSIFFNIYGMEYTQVCGKIVAYQDASTDAFFSGRRNTNINGNYVDGITLTHGSNPREHIWTFAAALDEVGTNYRRNCPCTNTSQAASATQPPSFVGNDYFCDTASTNRWDHVFYPNDPLWDGAGCGPANTCCSLNNPPWFLKQLPSTTTDDIEMRMCRDQPPNNNRIEEDTPIEVLELYIC